MEKETKTIKIFFDYQAFNMQKYGGISRYFANIFNKIKNLNAINGKLGLLFNNNYYLINEHFSLNFFLFKWFFKKESRIKKWNKVYCKYLLKKNDFDIFHPTYFHPYFIKYLKKPLVITIHDMTFEALPEYFPSNNPLTLNKRILAENASKIIAISQNTKLDIIKFLKIDEEKIEVIYHGIDLQSPIITAKVDGVPDSFLLFVGDRDGYKNFYRYITACQQLLKQFEDLRFVFVGGGSFKVAETEKIKSLDLTNYCIQLSTSDEQLNYLYQKAKLFVFPSIYEGFGLPILEAFKTGCPIVGSNNGCFEEIAKDAMAYFDPYNSTEIYNTIYSVLQSNKKRELLITNGFERVKFFCLEKQMNNTINLYKKIM